MRCNLQMVQLAPAPAGWESWPGGSTMPVIKDSVVPYWNRHALIECKVFSLFIVQHSAAAGGRSTGERKPVQGLLDAIHLEVLGLCIA